MREIKAIVRPGRLDDVLRALHALPHLPGATVSRVEGVGRIGDADAVEQAFGRMAMAKIEMVVPDERVDAVIAAIATAAHTGRSGDGKIFVVSVDDAIKVRSGERGVHAL